ncbi:hypothetical protein [Vibrio marisflavi]|nr:hypothetical protein [Vibrio marisflavi]
MMLSLFFSSVVYAKAARQPVDLASSCYMITKPLDFGEVKHASINRQTAAFKIVCASATLPNGVVTFKVHMRPDGPSNGIWVKLANGMSFSLYSDPACHHPISGNAANPSNTITGQFVVTNHHGSSPWVHINSILKVSPQAGSSSPMVHMVADYQLNYQS